MNGYCDYALKTDRYNTSGPPAPEQSHSLWGATNAKTWGMVVTSADLVGPETELKSWRTPNMDRSGETCTVYSRLVSLVTGHQP